MPNTVSSGPDRLDEPVAVAHATYDHPTVEWVKDPVDLETRLPNGRPIAQRHFVDCTHWHRDNGAWIGEPPRLASDHQMRTITACKDCARRADRALHPTVGERLQPEPEARRFWWVSQGDNFDVALEQATLWSLPSAKKTVPDRRLLQQMRTDDVVLHYARGFLRAVSTVRAPWTPAPRPAGYERREGEGDDGWLVAVTVHPRLRRALRVEYLVVDEHGRTARGRDAASTSIDGAVDGLGGRQVVDPGARTRRSFARHRELHARAVRPG